MLRRFDPVTMAFTLGLAACSGASSPPTVPPSTDSAAAGAEGASTAQPVPIAAPAGKRKPCASDQACNDDPSVSALWGRCTDLGVCECQEGFELNPATKLCRPGPAE